LGLLPPTTSSMILPCLVSFSDSSSMIFIRSDVFL
jgi:hypothetical protein